MATIKVREGLEIGDGQPTFVIAEVGSNWKTREDCLHSINMAKACGADAVKFQAYTHESLYGLPGALAGSLAQTWLPHLKAHCDAMKIEFMCSAFSPELYDAVNPYVNIHKVASAECNHLRILEKLKSYGKPVILSTGATTAGDLEAALLALGGSERVIPMYCVGSYPANEIRLSTIPLMKGAFSAPLIGYSDHSTDVLVIPKAAADAGACVIEKHFNAIDGLESPDSPHSLGPDQFKRMVKSIRGDEATFFGPVRAERSFQLRHNRRLIATHAISEGDAFDEGKNFGIYRSLKDDTHAYHPFMVDQVHGKIARKNIAAGDGIGPGDI